MERILCEKKESCNVSSVCSFPGIRKRSGVSRQFSMLLAMRLTSPLSIVPAHEHTFQTDTYTHALVNTSRHQYIIKGKQLRSTRRTNYARILEHIEFMRSQLCTRTNYRARFTESQFHSSSHPDFHSS